MKNNVKTSLVFLLLVVGTTASANIPWPYVQSISTPGMVQETASLFVLPDGSGPPLTEAQVLGVGTTIDATITIVLTDGYGYSIVGFPSEDVWLDTANELQHFCPGGGNPDGVSSNNGTMTFSSSLAGGGSFEGPVYVWVNGTPALDPLFHPNHIEQPPVPIHFNSADISGDGTVDLIDVGLFATDFFNDYQYRSDFFSDGVLNLADVGRMATGLGTSCQ